MRLILSGELYEASVKLVDCDNGDEEEISLLRAFKAEAGSSGNDVTNIALDAPAGDNPGNDGTEEDNGCNRTPVEAGGDNNAAADDNGKAEWRPFVP
ncbi:hypothetical protein PT277_05320 [Acetobacteraceae bacterium ESL0709]|nr:hypothetical protein [Acetobacteraceae bacterium ESL0697]MDF7678116.1 hypothetical protein [Acetobacteraceae bacterium ESL0709]